MFTHAAKPLLLSKTPCTCGNLSFDQRSDHSEVSVWTLHSQVVCEELGIDDLSEVFEWIDLQEPIGSASISQVCQQRGACVHM
jgi:hypothetical protein